MRNAAIIAALCAVATVHSSSAHATEVVASIKPIHALVAGVMGEAGEPRLMISGVASPHTYQMRPSDAAVLSAAGPHRLGRREHGDLPRPSHRGSRVRRRGG